MIYFFNEKLELVDTSEDDVLVLTQKRELNGLITAYAEIKYKKEYEEYTYFGLKKGNNFYIHKIRKRLKKDKILILEGLHIFFYDLKGAVIEDIRFKDKPGEIAFKRILEHSNWELIPTSAGIRASKSFYNISVLEAFNEALRIWDVEFEPVITIKDNKIVKKAVRIVNQLSTDKGKWFEYGDKLLTVEAETSEDDVYTTFIGKGKGIEKFDEAGNSTGGYSRKIEFSDVDWSTSKGNPIDKPRGQNYITLYNPKHSNSDLKERVRYVDFPDIEDPEILLRKTYEYALKYSRPQVQFSSTALAEEMELGEIVRIIRDDIGIRYKARVFEIEEDFLTGKTMSIQFGDRVIGSMSDAIRGAYNEVKSLENDANSRIDRVYEKANTAIASANGKNTVFRGAVRPIANSDGDVWFRILPNDQIRMYIWDEEKNDWISQDLETPDLTQELTEYENKLNEEIDKRLTESEDNIKQNIEENNELLKQSIFDDVNNHIDVNKFENEFIEIAKKYNKDIRIGDVNLINQDKLDPTFTFELTEAGKNLKEGEEVTITFSVGKNKLKSPVKFYNENYSGESVELGEIKPEEFTSDGIGQLTVKWKELSGQEYLIGYYDDFNDGLNGFDGYCEWIKMTKGNVSSLDPTISLEELQDAFLWEFNAISNTLTEHRQDIGSIEKDLKSGDTFQKINSLEKTATETKQTIANIENGLTTEFNKKIENVEGSVTQLGKRVDKTIDTATFEKTINGMKSTLSSVQNDITSLATGGKNFISTNDIVVTSATMDSSKYATMGRVDISKSSNYGGIYVKAEHLEPKTTYILSFNYNKTSGTLVGLGGHTDNTFANNKVKTDGIEQTENWRNGASGFVADDENTHYVEVVFTTPSSITKTHKLYIQPNRGSETPVGIKIENLQIREGEIVLPWVQAPEDVFTRGEMAELEKKVSSIEQTVDSIDSTVSSTKDDLKKVTSRVQTAENEISKISSIEGDVSKLNTRIDTAESSISQISKLSNNLNNISSGGYNLISNGKGDNTKGFNLWGDSKISTDGKRLAVTRTKGSGFTGLQTTPFKVEKGRTYTIAFDFWSNADITHLTYNYLMKTVGANSRIDNVTLKDSKTENRYSITFTAPWDDDTARVMLATGLDTGQEMYFKNIMVTESTIPSSFGLSEDELIVESTNTIKRTYDSTISSIQNDVKNQGSTITQLSNEINSKVSDKEFSSYKSQEANRIISAISSDKGKSAIKQTVESMISIITANNLTTSIKQSANDIFMYSRDGSKITGFKLGASTAEVLGDFRVTGSMIVGGTLNASRVNIINLNANAITTGTLRGYRGEWNLQNGRFYTGDYADRVELYNGALSSYNNFNKTIGVDKSGLSFYDGGMVAGFIVSKWRGNGSPNFGIRHKDSSMTISYYNESRWSYHPYISFDKYITSGMKEHENGYPISIHEDTNVYGHMSISETVFFLKDIAFDDQSRSTAQTMGIELRKLAFGGGFGLFIGNRGSHNGLGISRYGDIYKVKNGSWSEIH